MKNKKYHTVGTILKSNIKIVEIGKIDTLTPNIKKKRNKAWMTAFFQKMEDLSP
jgi:hypothetical protein